MSYPAYKILHLLGVFLVFAALGGMTLFQMEVGRSAELWGGKARKLAGMTHGIALLLVLVTGFGALAKLNPAGGGIPTWVWGKLVIWLVLGGIVVLIRKAPRWAPFLWWGIPALGAVAAYLAIVKPG